jgi:hypothetical protein
MSEANTIQAAKQVPVGAGAADATATATATATASATATALEQQELQSLRQIITTWREVEAEASELNNQLREKKKRMKALEEMILRIMKKYTIGALDLKGSGGRILYRRQTARGGINQKSLTEMLSAHLKSETAANEAIKYINEHRGSKVRESLLYEKE